MSVGSQNGLNPTQADLCYRHLALLKKWNEAFNLTAITEAKMMWMKHVLDSVSIAPYLPKHTGLRFLDVGTGGGFPGVPLAVVRPDIDWILLDSNGKKIRFLTQVKIQLKLKNIFPIQARVEDYEVSEEHKFDGIVSRAFSSLLTFREQASHLLAKNGKFYAMKGAGEEAIPEGSPLEQEIYLEVPGLVEQRKLLIFS